MGFNSQAGSLAHSFGSIYQDDIPTTIIISNKDEDTIIDGYSEGINPDFIFQNDRELKTLSNGDYLVNWQLSFRAENANQEIEAAIMIGSTRQANTSAHRTLGTATDTGCIAGSGIINLVKDDLVSLAVRNETSTSNIIVEHSQVVLTKLR